MVVLMIVLVAVVGVVVVVVLLGGRALTGLEESTQLEGKIEISLLTCCSDPCLTLLWMADHTGSWLCMFKSDDDVTNQLRFLGLY